MPINPTAPINLIVTCESLKRPLTGIGYYTGHLLQELLADPSIGEIAGLGLGGYIARGELATLLQAIMPEQESAPGSQPRDLSGRIVTLGKTLADRIPGLSMALRNLYLERCARLLRSRPNWLLHAPNYIPPRHGGPTVITVHDLSHIRHPETHPRERIAWLDHHLPGAIAQASRIICVSDFTRREMLDLGLVRDESKLSVCHNGCDPGFRPRGGEEIQPVLDQWGLKAGNYILSAATLEPRKNLERVLAAYRALPGDIAGQFPLVLAGSPGWKQEALARLISGTKAPHRIIVTGYLGRNSLQCLMSGAGLFAYLSIYEGFGLPVIEAMASGTPVLTATTSALREVAGDWGYTVDPENIDAIRDAMARLLQDSAFSSVLRHRGLQRAQDFSWKNCARETVDVYKTVLAEHAG